MFTNNPLEIARVRAGGRLVLSLYENDGSSRESAVFNEIVDTIVQIASPEGNRTGRQFREDA